MLEGIKVIEYATYIAAPGAGGMLADWGADVIKIEPLEGDPIRDFFGSLGSDLPGNPVFDLDNRGKRSIAVDTSKPEGADIVRKLAADADVLLTNVRYPSLERAGLDYDSLSKANPKLVYCSVSGYGLFAEESGRPGFDMAAFWSRAGVGQITSRKGEEPIPLRTAFGDHVTSMATASGILAALVESQRTGKGRLVETSLMRTGIYSIGCDMAIQLQVGRLASTKRRHDSANPLGNFFQCADGNWICIVPRQGNSDWTRIVEAFDRPELGDDERFNNSKGRRNNKEALVDMMDAEFAKHDSAYWAERLDRVDLVWAPLQSPAQVAEDKQAIDVGAFVDLPMADGSGTFRSPATPVRFHGADDGPKGPSPKLGQHTDEVLKDLDLDVESLRASGVIL